MPAHKKTVLPLGERIAARAASYIGTKYWFGERRPGEFLDCAGVVVCALRAEGVICGDPPYKTDGTVDTLPPILEALSALQRLPKDAERQAGDVLVYRVPKYRTAVYGVCHLAIAETPDVAIHAADGRDGQVTRVTLDGSIVNRLEGVWRAQD